MHVDYIGDVDNKINQNKIKYKNKMTRRRGAIFSSVRGSSSTDFNDGINDHGAYGGKSFPNGFEHGSPYRYGYPSPEPATHTILHCIAPAYHFVFDPARRDCS